MRRRPKRRLTVSILTTPMLPSSNRAVSSTAYGDRVLSDEPSLDDNPSFRIVSVQIKCAARIARLRMNIRRALFIKLTLLLWIIGAQVALAQERIRLGLSSISATSGSIWVAEEKGLFKKHGASVEVIFIGGGASRVVSALLAGEIQFSVGGGDAVIRAAMRGGDSVLVFSPMNRGLQRLIVRPEIRTPAELKGKRRT